MKLLHDVYLRGAEGHMTDYDNHIAVHYAAFRPALHGLILRAALAEARFDHGLDVGCGTGRSSVALAEWCAAVAATDTSVAMLAAAEPHPAVRYAAMQCGRWPVADGAMDVVTFAGVLPYLDRGETLQELQRVCRTGAVIVTYDFAVDLGPVLTALKLEQSDSRYDHAAHFDGCAGIKVGTARHWSIDLKVTADEVAHLVLAGHRAHAALARRFGGDVFDAVRDEVPAGDLNARLFFTRHRLG